MSDRIPVGVNRVALAAMLAAIFAVRVSAAEMDAARPYSGGFRVQVVL